MGKNNCKSYSRKIWLSGVFTIPIAILFFIVFPIGNIDPKDLSFICFVLTPISIISSLVISTPLFIAFLLGNEYLFNHIEDEKSLKSFINFFTIFLFIIPLTIIFHDESFFSFLFTILISTGILSHRVWTFKIERKEIVDISTPSDILDDIDF